MSPEQARGDPTLDSRTDVFSLGCVLYEALTGVTPFAGQNALATLAKICFEEPRSIEALRPAVPLALSSLVRAMLAKRAAQRPSFAQLQEALTEIEVELARNAAALAPPEREALLDAARWPSRADAPLPKLSLAPSVQQRVICTVMMGRRSSMSSAAEVPDDELSKIIERYHARSERLLDGSHVLLFEEHLAADEQAVQAAYCVLSMRRLLPRAALVLCTGRAVVEGRLPLGELLERAARLLGETGPGQVRIDDASAGLLDARFQIRGAAGERYLTHERGGDVPRTLIGQVTPFVGRERELTQLELIVKEASNDSWARAVLVTAPAGAGKTRMRHELTQRLREGTGQQLLLLGHGDPLRARAPFGILSPAVRGWAEIARRDSLEIQRQKLVSTLERRLPGSPPHWAEFLGEIIGAGFPDHASPLLAAARREPQLMADHLLQSFLGWLEAECRKQPVLFLAEDLHWSDAGSVRFLGAALRLLANAPFVVLAFARPELSEAFPNLWAEYEPIEINLGKLSVRACERLLDSLEDLDLTPSARAWITERADGNPFFLEELVRSLKESRGLPQLPDTIVGLIQARLDALGETTKFILGAASIFGSVFRLEALRALLGQEALEADTCVRQLCERELIYARGGGTEREYVFRHALVRDAAYALMPEPDRKLGHKLAAQWLEAQSFTEPWVLADHFERGDVRDRAAYWFAVAAKQALEAGTLQEVVQLGEQAMANGLGGAELGEVASVVAEACSYAGENAYAAQWAEAARDNLEPGSAGFWRATQVLVISAQRLGEPERAAQLIEEMFERASPQPGLEERVAIACAVGHSYLSRQFEPGARLAPKLPPEDAAIDARTTGFVFTARALMAEATGHDARAAVHWRHSLQAFRQGGAVRDVAQTLVNLGGSLVRLGLHDDAEAPLDETIELSRRFGLTLFLCDALVRRALIAVRARRFDAAESALRDSAEHAARAEVPDFQAMALAHLAFVQLERGAWEQAAESAETSLALSESDPLLCAFAAAVQAGCWLRQSEPSRALASARHALRLVQQQPACDYAGFVRLIHLQALLSSGLTREAQTARAEVQAWLRRRAEVLADPGFQSAYFSAIPEHQALLRAS
jgi:tetratricopeptide (TPR) repeat protein